MSCLSKVLVAASSAVYRRPYELRKRMRAITTTAADSSSASSSNNNNYSHNNNSYTVDIKVALPLNSTEAERMSVVGWNMRPCALLSLSAHDKPSPHKLGFRGYHKRHPSSNNPNNRLNPFIAAASSLSSSSQEKGGSSPSPFPLSETMGSENGFHCGGTRCSKPPPPLPHQQQRPSKLLTLPTILTLGRIAAVPLLVCAFYIDSWWGTTATTSIFIAAAVTDWLDGYIARKMSLGTAFGAFLDPVADKLMVAVTLTLLCSRPVEVATFGQVPWLLIIPSIAIIGREITMSAVREWAASQNTKLLEAVAVNNLGKWKTATQMTALTILLATQDSYLAGRGILVAAGVILLYISAGLALWSLVVYMRKIWKALLK